jgi:ribosomal protein S2
MIVAERRRAKSQAAHEMERLLNDEQLYTLRELERFGWDLKFVRHPPFQPVVPIVFDPDRAKFAVLEADGTLNENPDFEIRA